jgi:uncharacterized protein (TIGR03435 family)
MNPLRCIFLIVLVVTMLCSTSDFAQNTATPAGASSANTQPPLSLYDVATIKPNLSGSGKLDIWAEDTTWRAANVSPRTLLSVAFGIDENLIFNLPSWTDTARYDISAEVSDPASAQLTKLTQSDHRRMLQSLLAERFVMLAHTELREEKTFELVQHQPVRSAPGLHQATEGSSESLDAARGQQRPGTHLIVHREADIAALIEDLSTFLNRPVIDHTGLNGKWDIDLTWLRDNGPPSAPQDIPADIFTAVREQLGLELRSTRTKVPVVVVDRWSQPTPN